MQWRGFGMDTLVAASADMKIGGIITNLDKTSI